MRYGYKIIRSDRKTMSLQVKTDGTILVRAPLACSREEIERMLASHQDWLKKQLARIKMAEDSQVRITEETRQDGIERAKKLLPMKVAYYAGRMWVTWNRITIREQKTRWGSCSSKGNLNFNWKLMLMPENIIDYVVVHELAHRREMNHSSRFWEIVASQIPDYERRRKQLNELGMRLQG